VSDIIVPVLAVALPALSYMFGVWVASEVDLRAFGRLVRHFDEDTRDHRKKTPKVRMTLYQRLIDRSRQRTQKLPAPEEAEALRDRRRVFLNFRSMRDTQRIPADEQVTVVPTDEQSTQKIPVDEQVTLRMQR
jgi:hypothetical protein